MNLLATGDPVAILRALKTHLLVTPTVVGEVLFLEGETPDSERVRIDLEPLAVAGVLSRVILGEDELELVVRLVRVVDDGEAEVMAVALTRGVRMATDDRKARRIASENGCVLLSTPELLHSWQTAASVSDELMSRVLGSVGRRSRYRPPMHHPLSGWWAELLFFDEAHVCHPGI